MQYYEQIIAESLVCKNALFQRVTLSMTEARIGTVSSRKRLYVYHETNVSSGSVWLGITGVGTATGFKIPPSVMVPLPITEDVVVFGIASLSTDLSVLELFS